MTPRAKGLAIIIIAAISILCYIWYTAVARRTQPRLANGCNCTKSSQCAPGELCFDVCNTPGQGACRKVVK